MREIIEKIVHENFLRDYRQDQFAVIVAILSGFFIEDEQHIILDAPTGSGKSNIAAIVAKCAPLVFKAFNQAENYKIAQNPVWTFKTNILTSTKNLQQQYMNDYVLDNLKGKMNYPCKFNTYYDSGDCFIKVSNKECNKKIECEYFEKRNIWLGSSARITNYSFQIEACDTITQHANNKAFLMILDECHLFGEKIQDHCSIEFNIKDIEGYFKYFQPKNVDWLKETFKRIENIIIRCRTGDLYKTVEKAAVVIKEFIKEFDGFRNILIDKRSSIDSKIVENRKKIRHLSDGINAFGEYADRLKILVKVGIPFLVDDEKLRPILPSSMSEFALFRKAMKFLHMSATICNPESYAAEIGISNYKFIKMKNAIPVANRTVYINPVQLVRKDKLSDKMMKSIAEIVKINKGNNGVIHTVSFDRAKEIEDYFNSDKFFISNKGDEIEAEFLKNEGKILLSPSVIEGYDFKDDMSRFQIFVKIPYLSVADKLNNYLFEFNKALYFRRAILKIVQGSGRSIRHKNDWALTYILDSGFDNLFRYNNSIFPDWFRESVEYIK